MTRLEAEKFVHALKHIVETTPDNFASKCVDAYPSWNGLIGKEASVGKRFKHNGKLFAVNQPHTFSDIWIPGEGTESLYREIPEWFAGTKEDPVPYNGNMELELGKFYTQNGVMYECIRATGAPVYDTLKQLSTMMGGEFVKVVK